MTSDIASTKRKVKIQIDDGELFSLEDADIHTIKLIIEKLPAIIHDRYFSLMDEINRMRLKYE